MRYFVIFLILIGFVGLFLTFNITYGLWVPLSPEELIEQSKTIFVGTVTYIAPVDVEYQSQITRNGTVKESVGPEVMTLEEYTIEVEEFLKNPQNSNTIKVLRATVGGVPSGPAKISGFENGDRVLFYLPKDEKQTHFSGQYLPESFLIPKECDAKTVLELPRIDGRNQFSIMQENMPRKDNFTANIPIQFSYDRDGGTLSGQSFNVSVGINKVTDNSIKNIFQKTIQANYELCEWISSANWDFIPEPGEYRLVVHISDDGSGSGFSRSFSVIENTDNFTKRQQIEIINDVSYFVSEPFELNSQLADISFHEVFFTPPYTTDPPRYIYSDVVFSDGTKERLSVIHDEPDFTEHVKPQAGLVQRNDGYHFLVSVNLKELSPLKQFNAGITLDKIVCKGDLVLIQKYNDSPACVKPETKKKLLERGWTKTASFKILGLDKAYVGEPINISVEKLGWNKCNGYDAKIYESFSNVPVWSYQSSGTCVTIDPPKLSTSIIDVPKNKKYPVIDTTGNYVFEIKLDNTIFVQEFFVKNLVTKPTQNTISVFCGPSIDQIQADAPFDILTPKDLPSGYSLKSTDNKSPGIILLNYASGNTCGKDAHKLEDGKIEIVIAFSPDGQAKGDEEKFLDEYKEKFRKNSSSYYTTITDNELYIIGTAGIIKQVLIDEENEFYEEKFVEPTRVYVLDQNQGVGYKITAHLSIVDVMSIASSLSKVD